MQKKKSDGWSISTVVGATVALIVLLAWCVLACEYAKEVDGWRPSGGEIIHGRVTFAVALVVAAISMGHQSLMELPKFWSVVQFSFTNRMGTVIGFTILSIVVVAGGFGMKYLEQQLETPYRRRVD